MSFLQEMLHWYKQVSRIGPLQLAIHVVQNRRAGEQKSHWDKTNKGIIDQIMYVFCLSCPSATFALQHGGFEPREWLAARAYIHQKGNRILRLR